MSFINDHQQKFADLECHLRNQDQLRRQANGGNSILFSYPPEEEQQYLEKAKELYPDQAEFIDISKLLVQFIDADGWESFSKYYNDFTAIPQRIASNGFDIQKSECMLSYRQLTTDQRR